MCGIAGFYAPGGFPEGDAESNIKAMTSRIVHRGPDGSGEWIDVNNTCFALGHRRLSVIDLTETGSQPMMSHSGRYVISYNGEIYNTRFVMEKLRGSGYTDSMNGTSDTEILLEAMENFGAEDAIAMCKGMFAVALYDREEKLLWLFRDRMGEKPLYYRCDEHGFFFASELGALRAVSGFTAEINYDCIGDYLKYGYISAPHTIYKNVYKLEPGCGLKVKCELNKYKEFEAVRYWDIMSVAASGQRNLFKGSKQEAADRLEELLCESIKEQMISDVPLGAFLSAGIDSVTIASLMQKLSDKSVRTFTIGFEEASYNEADDAAAIAQVLGTDHTELFATRQDAMEAIPRMAGMFSEPFADSSQIPTYLVSRLTREHVTVSLSGDGGDELFAGYRDYRGVYNIYKKIHSLPYPIRSIGGSMMEHNPIRGVRGDRIRAHGTLLKAKNPADLYRRTYETWPGLDRLSGIAVREGCNAERTGHTSVYDDFVCDLPGDDVVRTAMLMNMKMYLPDDILTKVDRTAMSVSLETRIPLLDKDVIEYAWTLPTEYLTDGETGKLVLRDVVYRHVDRSLLDRPKHGFGVPVSKWLKEHGLREWAEDLLNPDSINKRRILDPDAVNALWRDYTDNDIWRPQIWYVLMLLDWLEVCA